VYALPCIISSATNILLRVRNAISFIKAVLRHWGSLLTSGVIVAFLGLYEHLAQRAVSATSYGIIALIGVIVACYLAWLGEKLRAETVEISLRKLQVERVTEAEIAELRAGLTLIIGEANHWAIGLNSAIMLPRNANPSFIPERWTAILQIAGKVGAGLHRKLLELEKSCRDVQREIADICSVPESYRFTRQGQIYGARDLLAVVSERATEALNSIDQGMTINHPN
jgi:hypothetical protein